MLSCAQLNYSKAFLRNGKRRIPERWRIWYCCAVLPSITPFRIKCFAERAPALVLNKSRKHLDKWSSMSSLTQDLYSPITSLKQTPDSCEASHPCRAALEVTGLPARKNGDSMRTKLFQSGGNPASLSRWRRVLWPISVLLVSREQEALSYVCVTEYSGLPSLWPFLSHSGKIHCVSKPH